VPTEFVFSYRRRMFSTSLGNGDKDEGEPYLVEYGDGARRALVLFA
jgi:hypothetical protein